MARSFPLLFCFFLVMAQGVALAQSGNPQPTEYIALSDMPSTREALLLFWEEKDLVITSATRAPKPLSHTAENMVVITAREIEEMNAHTLAEVLNTVSGIFVDFQGLDFGTPALFHVQGSEIRHVTVMLDGFSMNSLADGNAATWLIPPKIIERIEIIKGPASSTWGSALGGIINVITRNAGGGTAIPRGTVSASYGEGYSQDYGLELFGRGWKTGYYLFAGKQRSSGVRYNGFDMDSLYGKIDFRISPDLDIQVTAGYTDPEMNTGGIPVANLLTRNHSRVSFTTVSLDYRISEEMVVKSGFNMLNSAFRAPTFRLSTGALTRELRLDETTWSGNIRLIYQGEPHAAVAGFEMSRGSLDSVHLQPTTTISVNPSIDKWAFFLNDTITIGNFSITPGVRFDHNSVSGSFVSPSLGLTFAPVDHTVFRAAVARGFTTPPLIYMSGGGRNLDPNPALKEENVWSYQGGIESGALEYVLARVNYFRHDMRDALIKVTSLAPRTIYVNNGSVIRQGVEAGIETAPFFDITLKGGFSLTHVNEDTPSSDRGKSSWDNYSYNLGIKYDDRTLMAQLSGTYLWWDYPASSNARYDDFLWDFNISRKFSICDKLHGEVFGTVHNLFNNTSYTLYVYPNSRRWVEGGIRLQF